MSAATKRFISVMVAFATATLAQSQKPYTILPSNQAQETTKLCSRAGFLKIDGSWLPADADIKVAESQLAQLSQPAGTNHSVKAPANYFRQYVGVVVSGRKLIYLNAMGAEETVWKTKFISVCDGGSEFWGAVFDPATHKFSDLQKNGPF
jgi:hypothetical protein